MTDPMNNNTPFYYYSVLDVPNDAPISAIKTAYRKKALKYHPDKCKDPKAAETFKEINHAFHVLSDVDKRRCYDSFGGVERPEIPITITKPFEEFCEGIALGSFSVFANLGFIALFGTPAIGLGGWLLATQFITAFHMIPESLEEAKDYRNWSRPLGALMAPLFLITSGSCAAGYLIYNGSKMALEYSKEKLGTIGESIKKGVQTLQGRQNLSITLDDWVVLDEGKKNTRKSKSSKPETKVNDRAIVLSPPVSAKRHDDVVVPRKVEEISKQVRNDESIFGWDGSVSGGVQDELSHVTKADLGVRDTKDEIDLENFHLLNSRKSNLDEAGDTDWVLLDDLL